ncbi:MAG: ribonuclease E/G [Firmicutes bacterium]|nr:ribonuclease E/G [Bacillota bacterium]
MKCLLIEHLEGGVRTAITEDGKLREIFIDKEHSASKNGQVIVGRIRTIMPGQFAFIDIGSGKNAFANLKTGHNLKSGQPLLVQVQKDATSSKGAYVSQDISLKGWLVILHKHPPGEVGVSHKITDEKESRRLKTLVRKLLPKGYGAIVRTNAEGCNRDALQAEINKLHQVYEEILQRADFALPPAKLYPKIAVSIVPVLNDVVTENLDEICISGSQEEFNEVKEYICDLAPGLRDRIFHHNIETGKLFDIRGVKKQIRAALEKVVPLPCGGFITIEETEACAVIDVNTGNNHTSLDYRDTVLNTNLEAAAVIVDQVILRNLSGIIIIDFIDMPKQEDKAKLMAALHQEAKRDRTNPEIFDMTALGIVQIARPKRRLPLSYLLEENCPHCGGRGRVRSS